VKKVRKRLPVRRSNPTKSPTGKNWAQHKPDLREDFNERCGYCGSHDDYRHTYFEVDHFVPKSLFEITMAIGYCQYDNLVYSCKFCNGNKLAKWPSMDESIPVVANEGFVDPCNPDYETHVFRSKTGGILWHTELGKWLVTQAFKFDERDSSIKLLYHLDELSTIINELLEIQSRFGKGSLEYKSIDEKMLEYLKGYFKYHKQLISYYNSI